MSDRGLRPTRELQDQQGNSRTKVRELRLKEGEVSLSGSNVRFLVRVVVA